MPDGDPGLELDLGEALEIGAVPGRGELPGIGTAAEVFQSG
jgi:hypothetical protein